MAINQENLIWIDLEMTGLDSFNDVIIEIATIVTDKHLNILGEGPVIAIHQPDEALAKMDDWNQKQHGGSGLVARVQASQWSARAAELAGVPRRVRRGRGGGQRGADADGVQRQRLVEVFGGGAQCDQRGDRVRLRLFAGRRRAELTWRRHGPRIAPCLPNAQGLKSRCLINSGSWLEWLTGTPGKICAQASKACRRASGIRKLILPFFPIGTGRTKFSPLFFNNDRFCGA